MDVANRAGHRERAKECRRELTTAPKAATHGPSEPPDQDPPYDRLAGFVPPVTKVPQKPGNELGMRESGRMAAAEAWIEYVEIQFNSI